MLGEIIPKLSEAILKFVHVDRSRAVPVNVREYLSPFLDILIVTPIRMHGIVALLIDSTYFEDTLKFRKCDCTTAIRVLLREAFRKRLTKSFPQISEND